MAFFILEANPPNEAVLLKQLFVDFRCKADEAAANLLKNQYSYLQHGDIVVADELTYTRYWDGLWAATLERGAYSSNFVLHHGYPETMLLTLWQDIYDSITREMMSASFGVGYAGFKVKQQALELHFTRDCESCTITSTREPLLRFEFHLRDRDVHEYHMDIAAAVLHYRRAPGCGHTFNADFYRELKEIHEQFPSIDLSHPVELLPYARSLALADFLKAQDSPILNYADYYRYYVHGGELNARTP